MITLHPEQQEVIQNVRRALAAKKRRIVIPMPTGTGKMIVAAEIIRLAREKSKRVVFIAPRRELIKQASRKLDAFGVHDHGIILAGAPRNLYAPVQIASFDTLHSRGMRRKSMSMPPADMLIIDEAHLAMAPTRRAILEHYSDVPIIELTATPATGSGKSLSAIADEIVECINIQEAIAKGYLAPPRYFAPTEPDLKAVKVGRDGDYDERQLAEVMDQPRIIGDILDNWTRIAYGLSTVIFCVTRDHARHVCAQFVAAGIKAEYVDGETPTDERDAIMSRVDSGETTVLVNVFVASYGLDIPRLQVAVLARPTKSLVLYIQTCGRVLRPFGGKDHAIIIDHSGAVHAHGMLEELQPWSLDDSETVQQRKLRLQQERKAPKEITCSRCRTVFTARHECPNCGFCVVPRGHALPVHEADLVEVKPKQTQPTVEDKAAFIGELRGFASKAGKSSGWVANKFREKFSEFPQEYSVRNAVEIPCTDATRKWIVSRNIAYAKGMQKRNAA